MAATKLAEQYTLHIQTETTYGTAETEGSAPYTLVDSFDVKVAPNINYLPRKGMAGSGNYAGQTGPRFATITFSTHLFGTAGNAWAALLLPACGFVLSGSDYVPSLVTPQASGAATKGLTLRFNDGVDLHVVSGAAGDFEIVAVAGTPVMINWTFRGKYTPPTAQTRPAYSITTAAPIKSEAATVTIASYTPIAPEIRFRAGCEIIDRTSVNAGNGGAYGCIVGAHSPRIVISMEAAAAADYDPIGDLVAVGNTVRNITALFGSSGNQVTLDFNFSRVASASLEANGLLLMHNVEFEPCRDGGSDGDDWCTLTLG